MKNYFLLLLIVAISSCKSTRELSSDNVAQTVEFFLSGKQVQKRFGSPDEIGTHSFTYIKNDSVRFIIFFETDKKGNFRNADAWGDFHDDDNGE